MLDNVGAVHLRQASRAASRPCSRTTPIRLLGTGVFPLQLIIPLVGFGVAAALAVLLRRTRRRQGAAGGGAEPGRGAPDGHQRRARHRRSRSRCRRLLAGVAGMLIAPLFSVHSDMGTLFGIKAFAVAILGGIGSAPGA